MALHLLSTITLWKKWNFQSHSIAEVTVTWRCGNGYFHEANVIVETLHQKDHQNLQTLWDEGLIESQLLIMSYSGISFPPIFTLEMVSCLSAPLPPSLNLKFLKARGLYFFLRRVRQIQLDIHQSKGTKWGTSDSPPPPQLSVCIQPLKSQDVFGMSMTSVIWHVTWIYSHQSRSQWGQKLVSLRFPGGKSRVLTWVDVSFAWELSQGCSSMHKSSKDSLPVSAWTPFGHLPHGQSEALGQLGSLPYVSHWLPVEMP